jgi:DMSO reductase family type II enzyme chaperone
MNAIINTTEALAGGYMAMAQVFSYPSPEVWQRLSESGLVDPDLSRETLEAEYLAAFEMGRDGKPVALFEGINRPECGRDGILQELLRFYEFFDVQLSENNRDYPDHLVTELEFVAWLCLQEHAADGKGGDAAPFRRAARDFLDRHLAVWLPEFQRKLEGTDTAYSEYGAALADLVRQHRSQLNEEANRLEASHES